MLSRSLRITRGADGQFAREHMLSHAVLAKGLEMTWDPWIYIYIVGKRGTGRFCRSTASAQKATGISEMSTRA